MAEAQRKNDAFRGAELALTFSTHLLDINSFNSSLVANRLPAMDRSASSAGVMGGVFIKRFWFGGETAWQFGANGTNDDYDLQLFGGNGMVKAGYVLVEQPAFIFYPSLGLGGGGTGIQVRSARGGTVLDDGMITPGRNLHSAYMLVDPGFNADFFFGENDASSRLLLGFSVGYLLTPLRSKWDYGDDPISSIQKFAPQGFYMKVKLGWNKVR